MPIDYGLPNGTPTERFAYGTSPLIYYVRSGGNDSNDGLTTGTAFATLSRLLKAMAGTSVNRAIVGDVTGMTFTGVEVLNMGGDCLGAVNFDLSLDATGPNNYISNRSRQLRADLSLVLDVTATSQALDAQSGLLTITVSQTLTAGAHRGRFISSDAFGVYAEIRDNGVSTIQVNLTSTMSGDIAIYEPSAEFRFGDPDNFFEQACYLHALCDWSLHGIKFASNGSNAKACALSIWPGAPVDFLLCQFAGIQLNQGPGMVTMDACYVHTKTFAHDGASLRLFDTAFRGVSFSCHGSGDSGINEWFGFSVDGCNSLGGGNPESRYTYQFGNFEVAGGSTHGIKSLFGRSSLSDGVIENCAGSAVFAARGTNLVASDIHGEGTTVRYGFEVEGGPGSLDLTGCDVAGALGDILVGAIEVTYGEVPVSVVSEYVRVV